MPLVTVTVDGAARRSIAILNGRVVRDEAGFKEADHPRASNGQFGSGGTVHVVTTGGDTGSEVRSVTDDHDKASDLRDEIEDDEEDDTAEHHEIPLDRSHDGPVDAVHVLHSGGGDFGVEVHGAYDDADIARGHAVAQSRDAWDNYGPSRSDLDRDDAEEDEAAERWNADHESEDGALLLKTNDSGFIERDANGDLQWVQDGQDVELDDEDRAAFDAHFAEMFPDDETAACPGLDAANDHFEGSGEHENVFRVHTHKVAQ